MGTINTIRSDLYSLIDDAVTYDVYNDYAPEEASDKGVVISVQSIGSNATLDGNSIYQTINFNLTIYARTKDVVCDMTDNVVSGIDDQSNETVLNITVDSINFNEFDPNADSLHVVTLSCNANLWVN